MDFKQLEAFTAVVENGSFSEAAQNLFLTQPTVSQHIRSLEDELGVRLISRTTKRVSVTPEGRRFYEYAVSILRLRNRAQSSLKESEDNVIHIGASTIPSAYIIPEIIAGYGAEHPGTVFSVTTSDSESVLKKLEEGNVDIAVVGAAQAPPSVTLKLFSGDRIVLATPADEHYKKLRDEGADFKAMMKEPFIMRERGSGTKKEAQYLLEKLGIDEDSLNIVALMNDPEAIRRSVSLGLGVSLVSFLSVREAAACGEVLIFDPPSHTGGRSFYVALRKDVDLSGAVRSFADFLLDSEVKR